MDVLNEWLKNRAVNSNTFVEMGIAFLVKQINGLIVILES